MSDIKFFRINGSSVAELTGTTDTVEKSVQVLSERNLEAPLGVRFLASEFVTSHGRRDSLGMDENGAHQEIFGLQSRNLEAAARSARKALQLPVKLYCALLGSRRLSNFCRRLRNCSTRNASKSATVYKPTVATSQMLELARRRDFSCSGIAHQEEFHFKLWRCSRFYRITCVERLVD
jgi:hypothetical protein